MFEEFFSFGGQRQRAERAQPGADLRHRVVLTLEEVARALETSLEVERRASCRRCGGNGLEPGTQRQTCPRCSLGKGQLSQSRGLLKIFNNCPDCLGAGTLITAPCLNCGGRRRGEGEQTAPRAHPAGGGCRHPPAPQR